MENLLLVSKKLENVRIISGDYSLHLAKNSAVPIWILRMAN